MRTYIAATVALDAEIRIPYGNTDRDAALFVCGKTHIHDAVFIAHQHADGKIVTLLGIQRIQNLGHDLGKTFFADWFVGRVFP